MAEAGVSSGLQPAAEPPGSVAEAQLPSLAMEDKPTCIICLGMAGSGKTTFVQVAL